MFERDSVLMDEAENRCDEVKGNKLDIHGSDFSNKLRVASKP